MWPATDVAGNPQWWWSTPAGNPTLTAATGSTPIAAGIGFRIIPGAGPPSTTDVGSTITAWAGAGLRTEFGVLRGSAGATTTFIAAGLRCLRVVALASSLG